MSRSWLSILGLYNYDDTIFDGITLPTAADLNNDLVTYISPIPELDREKLVEYILLELAELPLVYGDPDLLKRYIKIWSDTQFRNWVALWETTLYKYNPIWNVDGEVWEDRDISREGQLQSVKNGSNQNVRTLNTQQQADRSDSRNHTGSGNETINHNVTGFDTNAYSPDKQDVRNYSDQATDTGTGQETITNTGTIRDDGSDTETSTGTNTGTEADRFHQRRQGNIGVTMTQDMISKERDIVEFNMYKYITEAFKHQFCVMIY